MNNAAAYKDFILRLKMLISKNPEIITTTLSNIFTMRLIGNKTHGDMAEIAIAELINQYMYDFHSTHVGKNLYRSKRSEEDIKIVNEITRQEFPVSLKAYGDGPLQLSTDKNSSMFPRLEQEGKSILGTRNVGRVLNDPALENFFNINVLPLIYDEESRRCNILIFDYSLAHHETERILREESNGRRKHPVYKFYDSDGGYICEVRYGDASANALQRGLWTHTRRAHKFFNSITGGWIDYSHNPVLLKLFSHALVSSISSHKIALDEVKRGIAEMKRNAGI